MFDKTIQVMLVDDHPIVRAGYARLIEQARDMALVAEAGSEAEAIRCLRKGVAPDVVVTDLAMPGGGHGIELVAQVRAMRPNCHVLVFSMYDSHALVARALQAGAAGFLSKGSAPMMLVQAIRTVDAGLRAISPDLEAALDGHAQGEDSARLANLSEREFALFALLAEGCSINECAARLGLSPKTASNYQTILREKLGVTTSAAMAHLALRLGVLKRYR